MRARLSHGDVVSRGAAFRGDRRGRGRAGGLTADDTGRGEFFLIGCNTTRTLGDAAVASAASVTFAPAQCNTIQLAV